LPTTISANTDFSKTGANTWEVNVYNAASPATPLTTQTLTFDPTTGNLTPPSPTTLSIAVPGGNTVSLNIASMTQLASPFSVATATMDGNAPSRVQCVSMGTDGTLSYVYANGKTVPAYKIPLGNVISPDNLTNIGDVFQVSSESGSLVIGTAGTGALGTTKSSELESSTVDLATQLTNMVATQSAYGANSLISRNISYLRDSFYKGIHKGNAHPTSSPSAKPSLSPPGSHGRGACPAMPAQDFPLALAARRT
jgi:flagellar hook protein FlgE